MIFCGSPGLVLPLQLSRSLGAEWMFSSSSPLTREPNKESAVESHCAKQTNKFTCWKYCQSESLYETIPSSVQHEKTSSISAPFHLFNCCSIFPVFKGQDSLEIKYILLYCDLYGFRMWVIVWLIQCNTLTLNLNLTVQIAV